MRQEVAVAVWKWLSVDKNDAYAFAAGRHGAIGWKRQWCSSKSHQNRTPAPPTFYAKSFHDESEAYSTVGDDECCIIRDEVIEKLFAMILSARRAKGQEEIDGTVRAANIMRLLGAGYNNLGVAQEMRMTLYNVQNYRRQIRIILQALARAAGEV